MAVPKIQLFRWSRTIPAGETETWETRFALLGHPHIVFTEMPGKRTQIEAFLETSTEAEDFRRNFGGAARPLEDQNWAALGNSGSRGKFIRIRDRLIVALDEDPGFLAGLQTRYPNREILCFPPTMAFGTGDHATTSTCLRFLCDVCRELPVNGWNLLDLGTGTGILAVAACRLGAKTVVASDFDAKAIQIARSSLERHHLDQIQVRLREEDVLKWRPTRRYHVVAANLFSSILIQILPKIRRSVASDGWVILSGILRQQSPDVAQAARECGLRLERKVQRGKWVGLLAKPDK